MSLAVTLPAAPPVRFDGRSRARSSRCEAATSSRRRVSVNFTESSIRLRRRLAPPPPKPRGGQKAGGAGFLRAVRARNGDSTALFAPESQSRSNPAIRCRCGVATGTMRTPCASPSEAFRRSATTRRPRLTNCQRNRPPGRRNRARPLGQPKRPGRRTEIVISLLSEDQDSEDEKDDPIVLTVPWSKTPHRRHRDVIAPENTSRTPVLPIRSDTRVKLVTAIARGRRWLSEVEAGAATIGGIAAREACSRRHVNMTISLAFLAPSLVKAAVEGRLSHGIGVARLFDAPVDWLRQHQMLGLAH
jgi:hypothetical protein